MKYAIVLSAGKGTRMNSDIPKQYMELCEKPVIYHALKAFEDSTTDGVVLVCGAGDEEFCNDEIIKKYDLKKVVAIVPGGAYRFESVYNGIKAISEKKKSVGEDIDSSDIIAVHDGARPVVTVDMIERLYEGAFFNGSAIAACPAKDTIKIVNEYNVAIDTPERKTVWQVQTPQVFKGDILYQAYSDMMKVYDTTITDDAMVVEKYGNAPVCLMDTGYKNIKITTPEDLVIAKLFIEQNNR